MSLLLNQSDIDALRWVLRCYLADRTVKHGDADNTADVGEMFEAAGADRRAVIALLTRLDADTEPQPLRAAASRTRPIPAVAPQRLPVTAGARYPVRTA